MLQNKAEEIIYKSVWIKSQDNIQIYGNICIPKSYFNFGLVLYHGGKEGSSKRFEHLQPILAKYGIATLAIDFRGKGQSSGSYEQSSVNDRLKDASATYQFFRDYIELGNIGILCLSLAADEVRLLDQFPDIESIILIGPVAVSNQLTHITPPHKAHILSKKTNTWSNSRVFSLLDNFQGPKLIIYGEEDNAAPPEMIRKYKDVVSSGKFTVIENAKHDPFIIDSKASRDERVKQITARDKTVAVLIEFLKENYP